MADIQVLSSELHRNLRVVTKRGAEYGENIHIVPVAADELRNLVLEYPVILVKDRDSGRYTLCAMLGFEEGENLFLDGEEWDASYIPAQIRRQPFSLLYTAEKDGKPDPKSIVISIDMESDRIQEEEGEALFDEDGGQTDYLKSVHDLLAGIGPASRATEAFIDTLSEHDMIEPGRLDVQFGEGQKKSFDGLYSINEEKLGKLEGDTLVDFYKRGYLQAAWMLLASLGNMRKLLVRRTKESAASAQG